MTNPPETRTRLGPGPSWGATLWLLFLYFPVSTLVANHGQSVRTAVGLTLVGAFAVLYVVGFARRPAYFDDGDYDAHRVEAVWPIAGLIVLAVAAGAVAGWRTLPGFLIYVATLSAFRLSRRGALVALGASVFAIGAIHLAFRLTLGEVGVFYFLVPMAWWAVTTTRVLVEKNIELERARDQVAALSVTAERERVARDVHDLLGHSLTVIAVKSQLAGRLLEPGTVDVDRARAELGEIETLTRGALADVRSTVGGLRTPVLADEVAGCQAALRASGIESVVRGSVADVPEERRGLFAWALRECVTNVVRHSGAATCRIALEPSRVTVDDDGDGFDPAEVGTGGSGLVGLRDRARRAGAGVRIGHVPGGRSGTRVEVVFG